MLAENVEDISVLMVFAVASASGRSAKQEVLGSDIWQSDYDAEKVRKSVP